MEPTTLQNNTSPVTSPEKQQKPKALVITTVVCAALAVAGIAFGIYALLDSNQKANQISALKNDITEKEATIAKLEDDFSILEAKTSTTTEIDDTTETEAVTETDTNGESAAIALISELDDTDSNKVYKIGECTADSGTAASAHFSLKCHVTIAGKDALISYHDGDNNILRLSLPK